MVYSPVPTANASGEQTVFYSLLSYFLGGMVSGVFGEGCVCIFRIIKRKSKRKVNDYFELLKILLILFKGMRLWKKQRNNARPTE